MAAFADAFALALLGVVASASGAAGQAPASDASFGARARVSAPVAATNTEDATAAGSTVDLRERPRALESVAEAVVELPGTRVQSSGGYGGFTGLSLRGAELGHTSVLIGSVPLTSPDLGPFDLSLLPLSAFESIEVYRGGAPVWWSDGAIGGVVRVVPVGRAQRALRAEVGYGSFGRFDLSATSALVRDEGARPSLFAHVALVRADNDYAYLDDGQTRFDTSDDVMREQRNADIHAGDALLHAGLDALGGRVELLALGHGRTEGVPGPLAAPALHARHQLVRALGAVSYTREVLDADGERRFRVQLSGSGHRQQSRVSDPEAELGRSRVQASDDVWQRAQLRAAGSHRVLGFLEPTLVGSLARDELRPEDPLSFSMPPRPSARSTAALALELRAFGKLGDTRVELRPSTRLQWSESSIWTYEAVDPARTRLDQTTATHRVAGLIAPIPALAFSASAATGARLPSITELYGDRLFLQPNTGLRPERSRSFDAGVVARGRAGELRARAELRGFLSLIDELIRYERSAQYTLRAENIASARILGLELGAYGAYGRHLSLAGSLSALRTRSQFDRELPLRPPLQLVARPEVALFPAWLDRLALFGELEHVSYAYLDEANLALLPARTLLGLGVSSRLLGGHVLLQVRVRNLFDTLATDVLSRPLPGRELLISLAVEEKPE